ncbi:Uncharacterised protein [uncultured Bacteroides sp.]|nr:Uncharacterised protein [uncultured Bacteroides sp.]
MQNEMSQSFMYASFLHFYLLCSVKGKDDLLKLCYFIGTISKISTFPSRRI